jgi:hypothetical protein
VNWSASTRPRSARSPFAAGARASLPGSRSRPPRSRPAPRSCLDPGGSSRANPRATANVSRSCPTSRSPIGRPASRHASSLRAHARAVGRRRDRSRRTVLVGAEGLELRTWNVESWRLPARPYNDGRFIGFGYSPALAAGLVSTVDDDAGPADLVGVSIAHAHQFRRFLPARTRFVYVLLSLSPIPIYAGQGSVGAVTRPPLTSGRRSTTAARPGSWLACAGSWNGLLRSQNDACLLPASSPRCFRRSRGVQLPIRRTGQLTAQTRVSVVLCRQHKNLRRYASDHKQGRRVLRMAHGPARNRSRSLTAPQRDRQIPADLPPDLGQLNSATRPNAFRA